MSEPELKSALVEKPIDVSYDFGNLAVFDTNPLNRDLLADDKQKEAHLQSVARENVQLLVNQLLQLPLKRSTEGGDSTDHKSSTVPLFVLPQPSTQLPREKPIPKQKAPTKWELFAAKKGIQKKAKEGKLVWDEQTKEWVPKWGYKGKNKQMDDQWLVEVDEEKHKNNDGELVDPRSLNRMDRKRLVKKNQLQQERNAKRALGQ
ncbi:regulator of ribosome biosynthesis [Trichomonascus vanleenenianus]|uniref:ribosome biogenesis protein RRS1 n=1 Tax=Trichomonascus vanleenenianus TaxID=2268995 RepID=UPI003EC9D66A